MPGPMQAIFRCARLLMSTLLRQVSFRKILTPLALVKTSQSYSFSSFSSGISSVCGMTSTQGNSIALTPSSRRAFATLLVKERVPTTRAVGAPARGTSGVQGTSGVVCSAVQTTSGVVCSVCSSRCMAAVLPITITAGACTFSAISSRFASVPSTRFSSGM